MLNIVKIEKKFDTKLIKQYDIVAVHKHEPDRPSTYNEIYDVKHRLDELADQSKKARDMISDTTGRNVVSHVSEAMLQLVNLDVGKPIIFVKPEDLEGYTLEIIARVYPYDKT